MFANFWLFEKKVCHQFNFLGLPEAESFLSTAPGFCLTDNSKMLMEMSVFSSSLPSEGKKRV